MRKVTFYSPGTFISETNSYTSWKITVRGTVKEAVEKAKSIIQRYDAIPYGFTISGVKGMFFLEHCVKKHYDEIPKTPENRILLSNMETNRWMWIVETTKGWLSTHPFRKDDKLVTEYLKLTPVVTK